MTALKKVHKLQIRNKRDAEGKISVGANMEVLMDGVPLKGVSFFKFEVKARGVAKVMFEIYADVEIETDVILAHKSTAHTGFKIGEKAVVLHQVGSYEPKGIATKLEKCSINRGDDDKS